MFSFLFRLASKAAFVQKFRFVSLTATIIVAAALLVVLSALYLNGESQMAVELSGIPNIVVKPQSTFLGSANFSTADIKKIKSEEYFWHNNIVNVTPLAFSDAFVNGTPVKLAGTWFNKDFSVGKQSYKFGILTFNGWSYKRGKACQFCSPPKWSAVQNNFIIAGSNVQVTDPVLINVNGKTKAFHLAGKISTGSFWDNYIFIDLNILSELTGNKGYDEILISALFKPNDKLALKAEREGINSLSPEEYEIWSCSPYIAVVAQTMREELPNSEIKIQRRITEVQAGIIKTSSGVFIALFLLTLIASLTAIYSAEKMYVTSHIKDFGIMTALGASHKKIFMQLLTEISLASFLSAAIIYFISNPLVNYISMTVYGVRFEANSALIVAAIVIPFAVSSAALWFLRKSLKQNVIKLLK